MRESQAQFVPRHLGLWLDSRAIVWIIGNGLKCLDYWRKSKFVLILTFVDKMSKAWEGVIVKIGWGSFK